MADAPLRVLVVYDEARLGAASETCSPIAQARLPLTCVGEAANAARRSSCSTLSARISSSPYRDAGNGRSLEFTRHALKLRNRPGHFTTAHDKHAVQASR